MSKEYIYIKILDNYKTIKTVPRVHTKTLLMPVAHKNILLRLKYINCLSTCKNTLTQFLSILILQNTLILLLMRSAQSFCKVPSALFSPLSIRVVPWAILSKFTQILVQNCSQLLSYKVFLPHIVFAKKLE